MSHPLPNLTQNRFRVRFHHQLLGLYFLSRLFAGHEKESSVWTYFLYDNDCDKSMCMARNFGVIFDFTLSMSALGFSAFVQRFALGLVWFWFLSVIYLITKHGLLLVFGPPISALR